jgi:hypothetical protein
MQIGEALWREKEISRSMPAMEFHGFLEWIRHEAAAGGSRARESAGNESAPDVVERAQFV